MKKLIRMITIGAMALALSVSALAQQPAASPSQDDADKKAALYEKYTANYQTNSPLAYAAAKEYVDKYPSDTDDIAKYLKDYVGKYEKVMRKQKCTDLVTEKKWTEAFTLCKEVTAEQPDDLASSLNLSWAGWQLAASGNNASNAEATKYSTNTIQMIEAGKTLEAGKPFADKAKNDALGWLNYSLYLFSLANKQSDAAAGYLIKAVQFENPFKNDPNTYLKLVAIYGDEFEKRRLDYAARFDGKEKSPEGDATLERVKQEADLLIDAIARAIAYSGTDPKTQAARDELKKTLTDYYKFRHGSIDGIDALIAGIKAKPIPQPSAAAPTPVTTSAPTGAKNGVTSETTTGATTAGSTTGTSTPTKAVPNTTKSVPVKQGSATSTTNTNGSPPRR